MTFFAFLKGINVSGHKIIKMAELKSMLDRLGFKNVRTYIQSGNAAFESALKPEAIKKKIEKAIEDTFGFSVTTVIRSKDELEKIIKNYPFKKIKGHEDCKISVGFLEKEPSGSAVKELESFSDENEKLIVKGSDLYHLFRGNFSDSLVFKKNLPEKILKINCTVRNWNTVNKILNI